MGSRMRFAESTTGGGEMALYVVKLLAMLGAWLGWKAIPFILFSSSLIGVVIGGGIGLLQKTGLKSKIPFGPFLALSAIIYMFFGPELIQWYLHLR